MEYQFTHTMHGVVVKCSMDHEAFARWLNTEITTESNLLHDIFAEIAKCKCNLNYEAIFEGHEYSLYLSAEEVMAKANHLEMGMEDVELMDEGLNFYDEESIAFCGLEDFEAFLIAYQKFTTQYH